MILVPPDRAVDELIDVAQLRRLDAPGVENAKQFVGILRLRWNDGGIAAFLVTILQPLSAVVHLDQLPEPPLHCQISGRFAMVNRTYARWPAM
jgi:hypothetical protein